MKVKSLKFLTYILIIFFASCKEDDDINDPFIPDPTIETLSVFIAQTHVLSPQDDLFGLVSDKPALLKVNINVKEGDTAPSVQAILELNGQSETIMLSGPDIIPPPIDPNPGETIHRFEDSYTATINENWIKSGLKIRIEAGEWVKELYDIEIGAPNKVLMKMFDVHFFQQSDGDYPEGWKEELETKWPGSIELDRLNNIVFEELTIPPRGGNIIAARISSKEEYETITGYNFDGEQAAASQWNRALKQAAGLKGRVALFYTNIYGVFAGGQAGGFAGVGNGKKIGLLHHELGHALSLPHWGNNNDYPYKGDMHGIEAPDIYNKTHAGPTWAYDLANNYFIPPTIQENTIGWRGEIGQYKIDPMQGGGTGSQEQQYLLNHFSDYSVDKMRNYMQNHIVIWNNELNNYASWNWSAGDYTNSIDNNGVNYATERNIEVISVMAGVSSTTPQANIVYKPIGPYNSGVIELFNPENEYDRQKASAIYCPDGGCDVSVKVWQGGTEKTYMLPISIDSSLQATDPQSFKTKAINLEACNGNVTKVELLLTPDAQINGLPNSPIILYEWNN